MSIYCYLYSITTHTKFLFKLEDQDRTGIDITMLTKICAIIVTYGNRFAYLSQVIHTLLQYENVQVIVVDNNSVLESKNKLLSLKKQNENKIKILYMKKNVGSSGGYKIGIEYVNKAIECDFLWLLDDDNQPKENALSVLLTFWEHLSLKDKEKKVCLASFRIKRQSQLKKNHAVTTPPELSLDRVITNNNWWLGINIFDSLHSLLMKVTHIHNPTSQQLFEKKSVQVKAIPYGGMFFHKQLIQTIGLPDEQFFLYRDDYEYTYRITANEGKIFLLFDSILEDIDVPSMASNGANPFVYDGMKENTFRIYYDIRNAIILQHRYKNIFIPNTWVYLLNSFIVIFIFVLITIPMLKFDYFKTLFPAVVHGFTGKTGKMSQH